MAGDSNIVYWLQKRGYDPAPELVTKIREVAKKSTRVLEESEVLAIING